MKRNSAVDIIKFLLAIIIVLYHWGLWFRSGKLAVEAFFMITGYLMMRSIYKNKDEVDRPDSTFRFVLHKYRSVFLPLLFSAILGFLLLEFKLYETPIKEMPRRALLLLFEVFPLQTAGFRAYYATGVSWYLSAMLLSIAILHPIAKRNPERFAYTVAPVIALLCYGFVCVNVGYMSASVWILSLFNSGLLRGLAGISAGSLLFFLCKKAGEKPSPTLTTRVLFTLAELGGWYLIVRIMFDMKLAATPNEMVVIALFFFVLYIALSGQSLFALFINHKWTGVLSTASLYMYLNHYALNRVMKERYPILSWEVPRGQTSILLEMLGWYLLGVLILCLTSFALTTLTRYLCKVVKKWREERAARAAGVPVAEQVTE